MKGKTTRAAGDEIIIHRFGDIDDHLVEAVRSELADRFLMKVSVGHALIVPPRAYSAHRRQYRSTVFLDVLANLEPADRRIRLGIVAVDLFVPDLNFVFGEASSIDRAAVFSIARLDSARSGARREESVLVKRATTEAVHEVGHVLGLGHCGRPGCVMWFSNTLSETDRKGSHFCHRCAEQLRGLATLG